MKKNCLFVLWLLVAGFAQAQPKNHSKDKAGLPPMGFMTWNYFGVDFNEKDIRELADALVNTGLKEAGFDYVFIDDGWQGGRDEFNNMIADAKKFPSGLPALVKYVHDKGLKIGIYSDAALLTCGGYTGSLHFEKQDAKQFATWGFDYLKYDYCNAPEDWQTAIHRYQAMSEAIKASGRKMELGICEWGDRKPQLWAKEAGGQLWRTTADIRDKWKAAKVWKDQTELHKAGAGILDIVNINAPLNHYAGLNGWNDPDMLVVGLYGRQGPSGELGGKGCTDTEYQSQMSLWCLMASPLMISCDIRNMNQVTKNILLNKDIIAIDQDALGIQAERKISNATWQVFVKPLADGSTAVGILNVSDKAEDSHLDLASIGLSNKTQAFEVWSKATTSIQNKLEGKIQAHETKVFVVK
jgi:alpha-galactosidase